MPPEPGSPADWLRHARSDLSLARRTGDPDTLLETLCSHAQQAVEKCFKAVLVSRGIAPPATHNLKTLIERFPSGSQGASLCRRRRLQSLYQKLLAFRGFLQQYDPLGKFRNSFLDRYIFGNSSQP